MGKIMSETTKEILQIVIFLVVVGILSFMLVCYPMNRTKAITGRIDIDEFNVDSLAVNNSTLFVEAEIPADTFTVETDGITKIAGLYIPAIVDSIEADSTKINRGTAILLHDERADRSSLIELSKTLHESGFAVIAYDQRASGYSTGKYHGDGQLEALDLIELIAYLDLRGKISHPVTTIGFSIGADAVLIAAIDETRIDRVIAVKPYITTNRMVNMYRAEHDSYWLPFYNSLFFWWYGIRSGYAMDYREVEQIYDGATKPTIIFDLAEAFESEEFLKFKEVSDTAMLQTKIVTDKTDLEPLILEFMTAD